MSEYKNVNFNRKINSSFVSVRKANWKFKILSFIVRLGWISNSTFYSCNKIIGFFKMFFKLCLLSVIALTFAKPQHAPAAQFPAGVNPQDCPGFPICDNARLHNPQSNWGAPQPSWNSQPSWNNGQSQWNNNGQWNNGQSSWNNNNDDGQWNGGHDQWNNNNDQWNNGGQSSWNNGGQSSWNNGGQSWNGAPTGGNAGSGQFPAGVNPHSCPNYPFCNINGGGSAPVAAPPLPGWSERQYPAGVSPHQCPNFPYCK